MDFTIDYLEECFLLDEEEFKLFWKKRPPHHFKSKRAHSRFNTLYEGKEAGSVRESYNDLFYRVIKLEGHSILAHRVIWSIFYKEPPKGCIDHVDGNGVNNNISNLRDCGDLDNFNNSRNRRLSSNNSSGRTGVYWRKGRNKWIATGRIYNKDRSFKNFWLGTYDNKEDAIRARESWEVEYNFNFRSSKEK